MKSNHISHLSDEKLPNGIEPKKPIERQKDRYPFIETRHSARTKICGSQLREYKTFTKEKEEL